MNNKQSWCRRKCIRKETLWPFPGKVFPVPTIFLDEKVLMFWTLLVQVSTVTAIQHFFLFFSKSFTDVSGLTTGPTKRLIPNSYSWTVRSFMAKNHISPLFWTRSLRFWTRNIFIIVMEMTARVGHKEKRTEENMVSMSNLALLLLTTRHIYRRILFRIFY